MAAEAGMKERQRSWRRKRGKKIVVGTLTDEESEELWLVK